MDLQKQLDIAVQEKNLAVEKWTQSKLVIEKLEEEISNIRNSSCDMTTVDLMRQEYSDVIRMLELKINSLQEYSTQEREKNLKKGEEIKVLNNEKEELNKKCEELERSSTKHYSMYLQAHDEYLILESKIVNSSDILQYNENKRNYLNSLEDNRNRLACVVKKLSIDCNDLEIALEVCHKRIQLLEMDKAEINKNMRILIEEKQALLQEKQKSSEDVNILNKNIEQINNEWNQRLQKEIAITEESINKKILTMFAHLDNFLMCEEHKENLERNLMDQVFSNNIVQIAYQSFSKKLLNISLNADKIRLNEKIKMYKKRITDTNSSMEKLKSEIYIIKNELRHRIEIATRTDCSNLTNVEFEKQIKTHEALYNRWKKEVIDLISRFKERILHLKKSYNKIIKENANLKYLIENHICVINKTDAII